MSLPPLHVLEEQLRLIAEICERRPGSECLFDRMEAIVDEARAAEISDPVARMKALRAAQKAIGASSPAT